MLQLIVTGTILLEIQTEFVKKNPFGVKIGVKSKMHAQKKPRLGLFEPKTWWTVMGSNHRPAD
jgi:hypothetical protein